MKKLLSVLLILVMVFALAACGKDSGGTNYDSISDTMESEDGTYKVAFITDVGQLKDGSFNQFTWNGVKAYASENGLSYKYYQPANGNAATDDDRYKAMSDAAEAGAEVIVAAGFCRSLPSKRLQPLIQMYILFSSMVRSRALTTSLL